jgi:hypothetical protein
VFSSHKGNILFTEQQKARGLHSATNFGRFLISRDPAILKHPKGGWTLTDLMFLQGKIRVMVDAVPEELLDKPDSRLSDIFAHIRV